MSVASYRLNDFNSPKTGKFQHDGDMTMRSAADEGGWAAFDTSSARESTISQLYNVKETVNNFIDYMRDAQ